jgi:hypothetical protein
MMEKRSGFRRRDRLFHSDLFSFPCNRIRTATRCTDPSDATQLTRVGNRTPVSAPRHDEALLNRAASYQHPLDSGGESSLEQYPVHAIPNCSLDNASVRDPRDHEVQIKRSRVGA